jgi:YggT family protein
MGLSLLNLIRHVVSVAFEVYSWILIIRILLSWIQHNPYQPIIRFIYEVTEPFLRIFRRIIPPYGAVDFSPIVAFIALRIIEWIVIRILYYFTLIFY